MALALTLAAASLVAASPAQALSCAPPDPIEWEDRYPRLDAALIVEIDAVEEITDGSFAGSLQISATVLGVLKGNAGQRLEYVVPSLNPWGPYYEPGDEVAVIVEGGVVSDGRQNICGPWFEPGELRQAAERYSDLEPSPTPSPTPPEPQQPDDVPPTPQPPEPPVDSFDGDAFMAMLWAVILMIVRALFLG